MLVCKFNSEVYLSTIAFSLLIVSVFPMVSSIHLKIVGSEETDDFLAFRWVRPQFQCIPKHASIDTVRWENFRIKQKYWKFS